MRSSRNQLTHHERALLDTLQDTVIQRHEQELAAARPRRLVRVFRYLARHRIQAVPALVGLGLWATAVWIRAEQLNAGWVALVGLPALAAYWWFRAIARPNPPAAMLRPTLAFAYLFVSALVA